MLLSVSICEPGRLFFNHSPGASQGSCGTVCVLYLPWHLAEEARECAFLKLFQAAQKEFWVCPEIVTFGLVAQPRSR